MRRALGFLVPVLVAVSGCVSGGSFAPVEDAGPPNGDKDRTLDYWNSLRSIMTQRTQSNELKGLTNLVQRQSDTIRGLPEDGIDPELISTAVALATCQEKVIELAEIADFQMANLRASPILAREFAHANQQAGAAKARLANLHARLSARYGVAFVPFEK